MLRDPNLAKKRDKPPRRNRYEEWEKEMTITLETPIPEMPKEKQTEPNSDDLRKALKDVHNEIDSGKKKIEKLKDERAKAIDEDRKERQKNQGDLKGLFSSAKELSTQIGDLNDEKKLFEKDLEKLMFEKEGQVKQCYGKKLMKVTECEDRIDELDHRQKTEKLTATEERAILKDLNELKNSLPIIEKVDALEVQMRGIKAQKKEVGLKIRKLIDEKNEINQKIDEVKATQKGKNEEELKAEKKGKEDRPKHPLTTKIDDVKKNIEDLRKKKDKLKDDHDAAYKAWRDQNELEEKIKWIKRQKNKLLAKKREEEYEAEMKAKEEAQEAARKEEEALYGKIKKFQPQIDICQNLVTFLGTLKPKVRNEEEEMKHLTEEELNGVLNSGDWKKEKLHVLKKKEEEDEGLQPGAGKKKRQKNKKQHVQEDPKLTLTIETLNFFDSIKVAPPSHTKDIDASIVKINEKKEYFIKLSEDFNENPDQEKKTEEKPEGEAEKKEEEEKVENQEKKGKVKKEKIDLDNEDMFPSM